MLDNGICNIECFVPECDYDIADKEACLEKFYVTSDVVNDWDGTIDKPYPNIALALSNNIDMYAEVLMVGHGSFSLSFEDEYSENCFANENVFDVTIRPLLCSEMNIDGCYDEGQKAIIMVSNTVVCLEIYQHLMIKDVIFSQNDIVSPYCPTCNYCRAVINIDSGIYDDQGNILSNSGYVEQSYCNNFCLKPLLRPINGAILYLKVIPN